MVASACKAIEGLLAIHEFTVTRDAESTQRQSPSTPAWEQRKLGDIAHTTIGEFVIRTKQKPNSPYPVYNGGTSYTGFYDEYNNEANQIVISARGANAGFVNIVRRRFWGGNSCYAVNFIDKENFDLDFTYQSIKNNQSGFIENQQAANIPSVSKSDVETFVFQCPKFNEQRQIGTFFAQLDDLITLHQREPRFADTG